MRGRPPILYIAGASKEIALIDGYVADMRRAGFLIAHDWCAVVRAVGSANDVVSMKHSEMVRHAQCDLHAVRTCDIFWLIYPEAPSVGCWVELGAALATKRQPTTIISGNRGESIFTSLVDHAYETHAEAAKALVDIWVWNRVAT